MSVLVGRLEAIALLTVSRVGMIDRSEITHVDAQALAIVVRRELLRAGIVLGYRSKAIVICRRWTLGDGGG